MSAYKYYYLNRINFLIVIFFILIGILVSYSQINQEREERYTIELTLDILRTSFAIDHLKIGIEDQPTSGAQLNPFKLLNTYPSHYLGEVGRIQDILENKGKWFFDRICLCVGYLPINASSLKSQSGGSMIWYRVSNLNNSFELIPLEDYYWNDELIN